MRETVAAKHVAYDRLGAFLKYEVDAFRDEDTSQHRRQRTAGVSKSHILSAINLAMCMRGYRVRITNGYRLLLKLFAARTATLERHYRNFYRIDLLLIDALDYRARAETSRLPNNH